MSTAEGVAAPEPLPAQAARAVIEYLRSRGYRQAEAALQAETATAWGGDAPLEDDDAHAVMAAIRAPSGADEAARFAGAYAELRHWVDGSLDLCKAELHAVLYPVLVHCFLEGVRCNRAVDAREFLQHWAAEFLEDEAAPGAPGRRDELRALTGVATRQHLEENETAALFLKNRYELHLSSYAYELVLSFLAEDPKRTVLLRILNQRCRVHVDAKADTLSRKGDTPPVDEASRSGFISQKEKSTCISRHTVLWGRLRPPLYIISDEEAANSAGKGKSGGSGSGVQQPSADGKTGEKPADASKAGDAAGKDAPARTDSKADKNNEEDDEDDTPKVPHVRKDGTLSESLVPLKRYRSGAYGLETEEDVRMRATLGMRTKPAVNGDIDVSHGKLSSSGGADADLSPVLPSVLCYTFTNTRSDSLNCSALSQDGSQVVAGFGDSTLRLWDAKAAGTASSGAGGFGSEAVRLIGHAGPVFSVDWSKCARFVLSGSEDGSVRLWSTVARTDLVAYRGHNYPIWSVAFSSLDHYFASGSHDRTARIWVTDRVYPLRVMAGHLADVDTVRWHPNCNYIATGSSDRTARLWDLRGGRCVRVFGGQGGAVQSLAFSPNGRFLAVAGEARDIDVWDIPMGKKVSTLRGHSSTVWSMDFSRDGSILASGGADSTVRLWSAWKFPVADDKESLPVPKSSSVKGSSGTGNAKTQGLLGKRGRGTGNSDEITGDRYSNYLATLRTKQTPIHSVHFTRRNVLIASGSFAL